MNVIERLSQSLDELEAAINRAKERVSNQPTIIQRLNYYDEMLGKQRALTSELVVEMTQPQVNADKISSIIGKINGLSELIRTDAREVVDQIKMASPH